MASVTMLVVLMMFATFPFLSLGTLITHNLVFVINLEKKMGIEVNVHGQHITCT